MKYIKVDPFEHNGKDLATLEIDLDGDTLSDYNPMAEEFIAVVTREESVALCAKLMTIYNIRCNEIAEAMNIPGRDCCKEALDATQKETYERIVNSQGEEHF